MSKLLTAMTAYAALQQKIDYPAGRLVVFVSDKLFRDHHPDEIREAAKRCGVWRVKAANGPSVVTVPDV